MISLVNYRCCRCFCDFQAVPGPIECPNCEFKYVMNRDEYAKLQELKKAQAEFAEKKADACRTGDDTNLDPHSTCDCG